MRATVFHDSPIYYGINQFLNTLLNLNNDSKKKNTEKVYIYNPVQARYYIQNGMRIKIFM